MEISQNTKALSQFMRRRTFVRFTRRYEEGFVRGYVLDVGPRFFLLASVGDEVRFDGFSCYRIADVKNLKRDPYAGFAEAALKKFGERVPKKRRVSVGSTEELLRSAADSFPLLTILGSGFAQMCVGLESSLK